MLNSQNNKCLGCKDLLDLLTCSVDHVIAKARGGTNAKKNLQLLCIRCQTAKGALSMSDFIRLAHMIVQCNPNGAIGAFSPASGKRGWAK
jgi:hypothetical protein